MIIGRCFSFLLFGVDTLLDGLYSASCNLLLHIPGPISGHDNICLQASHDYQGMLSNSTP